MSARAVLGLALCLFLRINMVSYVGLALIYSYSPGNYLDSEIDEKKARSLDGLGGFDILHSRIMSITFAFGITSTCMRSMRFYKAVVIAGVWISRELIRY